MEIHFFFFLGSGFGHFRVESACKKHLKKSLEGSWFVQFLDVPFLSMFPFLPNKRRLDSGLIFFKFCDFHS